ncbi:MAG: hypothetical protein KFF73_11010, partial [Cyclobacteriaceae bacterium]|nr:hypothetical protein [Cyclobacteriaceae bacterium]
HEFQPSGIDVMACCAGATDTPNYRKTNPKYGLIRPSVANPGKVAESTLDQLGKIGLYIPGSGNRFTYFILSRFLTRKLAGFVMNKTMKDMYGYLFNTSNGK